MPGHTADSGRALLRSYRVEGASVYFGDERIGPVPEVPETAVRTRLLARAILADLVQRIPPEHNVTAGDIAEYLALPYDTFVDELVKVVTGS